MTEQKVIKGCKRCHDLLELYVKAQYHTGMTRVYSDLPKLRQEQEDLKEDVISRIEHLENEPCVCEVQLPLLLIGG